MTLTKQKYSYQPPIRIYKNIRGESEHELKTIIIFEEVVKFDESDGLTNLTIRSMPIERNCIMKDKNKY